MVGADVPGRPPPARTGTTPEDDASARAAEDVGPYQRRTPHDTQRRALTARAEPHTSCGAQGRIHMVGADVPGRPPPVRTGTTPVDDASTRAAEDVGPYQHRTSHDTQHRTSHDTQRRALTARAGPRISCGAQGRIHGRGGRPRPPAPRTHKDDAGGRCVRAGRRGRRPLPTPHSRGVQDRAHHVARRAVYMVGADVPGRPPPRTHKDDAGGRCVHAGRRGRRPLPTPHSRGVQNRAHIMWHAGPYTW